MSSYGLLSEIYDQWQDENDCRKWADYTENLIKRHYRGKTGDGVNQSLLLLDLGCGTGSFAIEMAKRGYDVLGMDYSEDMLAIAREKQESELVQFILQDITNMKLYGTVDIMVCYLDTINHILDDKILDRLFKHCKNYLNPDGLLIFDLATKHYFENILGNQIFYDIKEQYTLLWDNKVNTEKQFNVSDLVFFIQQDDGSYLRGEEIIKEKIHSVELIENLIQKNELSLVGKYNEFKLQKCNGESKRIFFVVKNVNDKWKRSLANVSLEKRGKKVKRQQIK